MRSLLVIALLILVPPAAGIEDVLDDMKTTKADVQEYIQSGIGYGTFSYPPACSTIPVKARAAVVRAVGEFARSFTRTEMFRTWYANFRKDRAPSPPEQIPLAADARRQQAADVRTQIAEHEKSRAAAPADQKALYNDIITSLKEMLKGIEKTDKAQDAQMDEFIRQANAESMRAHKEKLAAFEREYPAGNPTPLIKRRLEQFLKATAGVDFGAKLVKKGDVMVFANGAYEQKDAAWKTTFRAGKEAVEAARAFAASWLKEL